MNDYDDFDYPEDDYEEFDFDRWYSECVRGIREELNQMVEDGHIREDEAELEFLERINKILRDLDTDDW